MNGEEGFASLHSVWETQIEDKNFDISKGDLYLVRSAEIVPICDIEISELGLLCYDRSAKDLFNYVLIVDENGEYTVGTPKSKTSIRDIPMTAATKEILKNQKNKQNMMHGNVISLSQRVFENLYGGMVYNASVNKAISDPFE